MQLGAGARRLEDHFGLECGVGGVADPCRAAAGLESSAGAVERLALLLRDDARQLLGVGVDLIGRAAQDRRALGVTERRPGGLRGPRGRDGSVQVVDAVDGRVAHRLAGRGVRVSPDLRSPER